MTFDRLKHVVNQRQAFSIITVEFRRADTGGGDLRRGLAASITPLMLTAASTRGSPAMRGCCSISSSTTCGSTSVPALPFSPFSV
jgi:hypothetical protein